MVKRTLYFGNPAYLKTKTEQLVIEKQDDEKDYRFFINMDKAERLTQNALRKMCNAFCIFDLCP